MSEITYRDDMFRGKDNHPQCVFFEAFPSSPDPYETFFGEWFCHMSRTQKTAEICKGDYINCPLTKEENPLVAAARELLADYDLYGPPTPKTKFAALRRAVDGL